MLGVRVALCFTAGRCLNYLLGNSSDCFCFIIKLYDKEAGVAFLSIERHLIKDFLYQRAIFFHPTLDL